MNRLALVADVLRNLGSDAVFHGKRLTLGLFSHRLGRCYHRGSRGEVDHQAVPLLVDPVVDALLLDVEDDPCQAVGGHSVLVNPNPGQKVLVDLLIPASKGVTGVVEIDDKPMGIV